jgi:hypothetical protein
MPRILKRPMFRTGGTPNEGIMHGLVNRKGYNLGTRTEEIVAAMDKYAPIPKSRFPLGSIGLNLVSGEYAGDGLLSNIARSAKGPYEGWTAADDARAQALAKRKASAVGVAVSEGHAERLALMKKKADISKIQTLANDLQRNNPNQYPNTPEGRRAAFNEALRLTETSPGKPLKDQWNDIYRTEKGDPMTEPGVAENRADWTVYIRPNVPPEKRGGSVPIYTEGKGANAKDFVDAEQMEPGKVYWDEQKGTLWEVVQGEDGSKTAREVPNWRNDYFKS